MALILEKYTNASFEEKTLAGFPTALFLLSSKIRLCKEPLEIFF